MYTPPIVPPDCVSDLYAICHMEPSAGSNNSITGTVRLYQAKVIPAVDILYTHDIYTHEVFYVQFLVACLSLINGTIFTLFEFLRLALT